MNASMRKNLGLLRIRTKKVTALAGLSLMINPCRSQNYTIIKNGCTYLSIPNALYDFYFMLESAEAIHR